MIKISANPLFKRGELAVWDVADIPVGVRRGVMDHDVDRAFANAPTTIVQTDPDQRLARSRRDAYLAPSLAAVRWADLQPMHDVPRGRASMTAAQWGNARDVDGVCLICKADDSMWCDTVVHEHIRDARPLIQALFKRDDLLSPGAYRLSTAEYGMLSKHYQAALITGCKLAVRACRRTTIMHEMALLKHGPGGLGGPGPCDVGCRKCALAEELKTLREDHAHDSKGALSTLEARHGEGIDRSKASPEVRAAWSAALRQRVQRSEAADRERERTKILVDLDFEPWE